MTRMSGEKAFPPLVHTPESGLKQLDCGGLIAPIIEAIKGRRRLTFTRR